MDLNIEDLNKVVSTLVSKECLDCSTEKCFQRLILYTSENDVLLSQLAHILVSTKNQANCLFKSLIALHYTINNGDQKFIHYLSSNNLNFINLDKAKNKFNNFSNDYFNFLKKYLKYLQQKINVHKFVNGQSSWLSKLIHKNKQQNNLENCQALNFLNEDSVLQHDIIGEQLMKKISYVESQIDYLINEFTVDKLNLLFNENILNNVNIKNKLKLIEYVFILIIKDIIYYANYYHGIMNELVEQFESMNKKHCKDAIEIYRKLPEKVQVLRDFLENLNENLIIKNNFQPVDITELKSPSIEDQRKMEQHWNVLESKPKRKNSERRKEKSRYAARARRSEENDLLNELCELVPLPDIKSLDKASVMRLAIAFINTKQFMQSYSENKKDLVSLNCNLSNNKVPSNNKFELLNALDISNLMLILLTLDGDLVFVSPNVNNLIGLKQTEVLGMSIFDYVHPCDHEELKSILNKINGSKKCDNLQKKIIFDNENLEKNDDSYVSFMVRIKSTLSSKTKSMTLKSANYKMASFSGYCKTLSDKPLLVLSVNVLLPPCAQLQCSDSSVFVTKHSPDLKFINIDDKLKSLIKYNEKDLIGSSYFQYIHAADAPQLFGSFQKLLSKGEVETGYYRLLCKTGGFFWIQTKASLLTDHSTQKPQAILCIHYLLSELVCSNLILSSGQCSSICKDSFETGKQIGKENNLPDNIKVKFYQKKQFDKVEIKQNKDSIKKLQSNLVPKINCEQNQLKQSNIFENIDFNFKKNKSAQLSDKYLNEKNSAQLLIENCLEDNFSNHFVQDCKEFDAIFEKVKLKEQLKEKIENKFVNEHSIDISLEEKSLENNYFTSEPLFNTLKVFEPLAKEDIIQCDPSNDNSPAIYTPSNKKIENKKEIPCEPLNPEIESDLIFSIDQQPLRSTNTIFKPLTADIDSGFLVFTEDNVRLLSDDQADKERLDLTHLAPQAGDSCVQLDFDLLPPVLDKKISEMVKNMGVFQETNEENIKDSYLINDNTNQKELTNQNNSFKLTKLNKKDELELEHLDENLKHFIAEDVPIVQIKRQKLTNDNLKLYSYLNKSSIRDDNVLIQTSNEVLNSFMPNETQFLDYDPGLETNSEIDNNVLIDDFENSIEINQEENFIENKTFALNDQISFNNSKENDDEIQQVVEDLLINEENLLLESKLIESNKMKQLDQFNQVEEIIGNAFTNQSSILDSYLMSSVGLSSMLNNDEKETNQTNYQSNLAQKNLANNLINENMNSDQNLTNCVILNENTFNFGQTPLQNDPFLSFSPGYKHAHISKQTSTIENLDNSTINSINQNSNLPKIFLVTNNQENKKHGENLKSNLSNHSIKQISLNNQNDENLFQFNNSRSNSPSDYIKLDQKSVVEEQIDDSHISTVLSGQCVNNSQKKLSSQKLNGEDLLFSLTSEDLNDVANSLNYFPLLNSETLDTNGLTKDKTPFNGSSSVESSDSLFCSSVWDSPPSSSSNSSLNNDLDLPFILDSDSNELTSNSNCNNVDRNFIDSEFPFLSEDSILNSFVNSNLSDIINGDEFFSDKSSFENNMGNFFNFCDDKTNNSIKLKKNTLSTDSNLAKLLKEKLPTKLPKNNQQNKNIESLFPTADNSFVNQNKTDNTISKKTFVPISTNQPIVDNKNPLLTRKYTIQNLNVFDKNKKFEISKNCIPIAHSIKIIDPVNTVQVAGNTNVKYLLNSISASLPTNFSANQNQSNLNINLPPFNCTTLTNVSTANNLNSTNTNTINIGQANVSTAKSFIIKSVGGKVANGILYTPITTNSNSITYASNLSTINNQTLCTDKFNKAKVIQTSLRTNAPNLLVNNRKVLQKRPYSSMSISMSSNNTSNAKDLYSIDLVPKNINSSDTFLEFNLNDALDSNLSLDSSKKPKINSDSNKNNCLKLSSNSVLMNLLVNGEDLSNGYLNINSKSYNKCKEQLYKTQQQSIARIV